MVMLSSCACIYDSVELSSRYRLVVIYLVYRLKRLFKLLRNCVIVKREILLCMSHAIDLPSEP